MDYALAKDLKDAGFPQKRDGPFLFPAGHNPRTLKGQRESRDVSAFVPSLAELLQAWGRDALTLRRDDLGRWHAVCANQSVTHASLEEAVARLWLAVNASS
jgi:hypothetical protein